MAEQPLPDAVALAYVHANEVAYSWHHSVQQLLMHDLGNHRRIMRGGVIAIRTNAGQLVPARNKAVRHLLEDSDVPWLLWVDTDMGFGEDLLERLLAAADPVDRPIVGALCFSQRELAPDGMGGYHTVATPTIFRWVTAPPEVAAEAGSEDLSGFEVVFDYPANSVVRCDGTGSAAVLVHRSVYERVAAKYGAEWYHRVPARDGSMGEDLSFCMRAAALGIPIHVHTGVRTTHAKRVWVAETDYLEQSTFPPASEEVAVLVPVMGRPEHASPFMRSLRASTGLATAYAICDHGDEEAAEAWKQAGAVVMLPLDVGPRLEVNERDWPTGEVRPGTFAEKVNEGYRVTSEPWLLLVGSDVRFHAGWLDHALFAAGDRFDVVGTNDMANPRVLAGEHATHPLIRRSYVDKAGASWDGPGVVCHEGYAHWFVDDEVVTAAKQRGVWTPALGAKVEHLHPLFGQGKPDRVYELGQSYAEQDRALWQERLAQYGP